MVRRDPPSPLPKATGQLPVFLCSPRPICALTWGPYSSTHGSPFTPLLETVQSEHKHLSRVFHGGSESRQVSCLEGALGQLFPMC